MAESGASTQTTSTGPKRTDVVSVHLKAEWTKSAVDLSCNLKKKRTDTNYPHPTMLFLAKLESSGGVGMQKQVEAVPRHSSQRLTNFHH